MAIRNPLAGVPTRAARWSATHPWRAILGWIGLVTVAVGLAVLIPTNETDDMDYRKHESGRAAQWLDDAGFPDPVTENLLITSADGPDDLDTPRAEAAAEAWGREMADLKAQLGPEIGPAVAAAVKAARRPARRPARGRPAKAVARRSRRGSPARRPGARPRSSARRRG